MWLNHGTPNQGQRRTHGNVDIESVCSSHSVGWMKALKRLPRIGAGDDCGFDNANGRGISSYNRRA